jgi:hypothetical protein
MEQGELEVYWGQPFLVKSNIGYWDWPAGQKARLPNTQVNTVPTSHTTLLFLYKDQTSFRIRIRFGFILIQPKMTKCGT